MEWSSCIIFTATKRGTDQLERLLTKKGIDVASIHGDRDQSERSKALNDFKNGNVPIIVATDVLSRGIDIADVSLIINYDVPKAVEDYIHRIGRTGRYDKTGTAVTLVAKKDLKLFKPIRDKVGHALEIIDGDKLLKSKDHSQLSESKHNENSTTKKESSKNSNHKHREAKTIKPNFSNAKNIKVNITDGGLLKIELLNKPKIKVNINKNKKQAPSSQKESKPKEIVVKKNTNKQNKASKNQKNQRALKKTPIEIKKIDKASIRKKNSRKPAKGFWGLIKSMLPKF